MSFFSGFSTFGKLRERLGARVSDQGRYRHRSRTISNPGTITKDGGTWILTLTEQERRYAKEVPFHDCIILNDSDADINVEINQNGEVKRVPSASSFSVSGATIYSIKVTNVDPSGALGHDISANEIQVNLGKDVS